MAMLSCRHCGASINSDARLTQCKKCGALFPFVCKVCSKQLRPPFPVFEDERYLSLESEPLCGEHFLRKCPDCNEWFSADENPGFFRCRSCADIAAKKSRPVAPAPVIEEPEPEEVPDVVVPPTADLGINPNLVVLGVAGCAFLGLLGWYVMSLQ